MKKVLSVVLTILMILSSVSVIGITSFADTDIPEGYTPIYTVEDLYCVRYNLSGNYILMNDIDLSEDTAEGGDWDYNGRGWNPIGSDDKYSNKSFSGVFDGNNYSIIGMHINQTDYNAQYEYVGLFAYVTGTVKNLCLSGCNIVYNRATAHTNVYQYSYQYIGGIAGYSDGIIQNCKTDNTMTINNKGSHWCSVGGIVGEMGSGQVKLCCNYSNIRFVSEGAIQGAAGIAGRGGEGKIDSCYNMGDISSADISSPCQNKCGAAGISSWGGVITNCFNAGSISRDDNYYPVGIAYGAEMHYCYNVGQTGTGGYAVTWNNSAKISRCYYLAGTGDNSRTEITSLTAAQAKIQALYENFDFDNVWFISQEGDYHYPQLRNNLIDKPCIITGHEYRTETNVEPTCTEAGSGTKTCIYCGKTEPIEIAPLGHIPETEWRTTLQPTCIEDGEKILVCSVCGETIQTEKIDKKGHTPGEWRTIETATCTQSGTKVRYCTVCEELIETKTIPAKGHNYNDVVTLPTCTEQGYTKHTCLDCGYEYIDSYVGTTSHSAGNWVITKEPTCTESGIKVRYCTECNEIVSTANIAALGHTPGEWIVTKEPTYDESGLKIRKCSVCGEIVETQTIQKLVRNGFITEDNKTYYYVNDVMQKGLKTIDGKIYYFGSDGAMYKSRLISVSGKKYYLGKDGVAYKSKLISVDGKKYYIGSDCVAYKSKFASLSGKKYYFGSDCVMVKSKLISVDGKKYYMGSDGVMYKSKLISVSGKKYYLGKDGVAYKSKLASISGKKYYFGSDCAAYKSKFASISGKKYYFGSDCVMYKSKTFSVSGVKWKADSNGVCKKV